VEIDVEIVIEDNGEVKVEQEAGKCITLMSTLFHS
jgi:hypothetical protein